MQTTLVLLAAGMGSRYGGLKQIDGLGPSGQTLMDYSIYDAIQAGFTRIVFIIKEDIRDDFEAQVAAKWRNKIDIAYAYQSLDRVPVSVDYDPARTKPLGTAHALYCAKAEIPGPFCVLNADDYYGPTAFKIAHKQLTNPAIDLDHNYALVAYELSKTVSEFGSVSRGICQLNAEGEVSSVYECKSIARHEDGKLYDDSLEPSQVLDPKSIVSMNFWALPASFLDRIETALIRFLETELVANPLKSEFFLPVLISQLVQSGEIHLHALPCSETWFGVTYQDDKEKVMQNLARRHQEGLYPAQF
ncbi:MAG: sugar phosphate nucleotidyltransferase [Eubacteriales bacterium]|nr:sugar phosphate nucleotidyltransferase [Eubacteriales bacterium]